jgi:hypothetical protein
MFIIDIKINNKKIYHFTAINTGHAENKKDTTRTQWRNYRLHDGCIIKHNRKNGALCLAFQIIGHLLMCKK